MPTALQKRLAKLETTASKVPLAIDFVLRFVSTDGKPDRVCRLVEGALVDVEPHEFA